MHRPPCSPASASVSVSVVASSDFRNHPRQARGMEIMDAKATSKKEWRATWMNYYLGAPGTVLGASLGLVLAYIVTHDSIRPGLKRYDAISDRVVQKAINQLGVLYLRALSCVIFPQCFFNLIVVAADITAHTSRRLARSGWRVVALSAFTSLLVVGQGLAAGLPLAQHFQGSLYVFRKAAGLFQCPSSSPDTTTYLLVHNKTQELYCGAFAATVVPQAVAFPITDLSNAIPLDPNVNRFQLIAQAVPDILKTLLPVGDPSTYTNATNLNVVHLVLGALAAGIATGVLTRLQRKNILMDLLRELVGIFETMTSWVVALAPVAMVSLVAGPIYMGTHNVFTPGVPNDLVRLVWYVLCFVGVALVHSIVVLPLVLLVATRGQVNPLRFFLHVNEALRFNFGASSSRYGQPVLTRTFDRSIGAPSPTSRFALDIGVTVNKNGGALYLCLATLWLFSNAGLESFLTTPKIVLTAVVATLGSYAIVPVRNGGVAIVICVFAMLTGLPSPNAMNFLLLAECILDPLCTAVNAWSNAVVSRIVVFLKE
ncbi:Aste57867_12101 [Aphanomyces stellatus]|uniref:Amino acid transporter n=1 Tax=Aphanomyces stellatus TaxID=120398 RepID=A0A485KV44_9STRA|nr:hypothetical protein As57867_012056 [Aphanomyces stellatus]VFT88956.1 Aste57867_12101 [Aphanomyces stellatus]